MPVCLDGSAMKSRQDPSFEFSVTSQEGISLFVDISSSSSDWYKRLANEICICQAFKENKFQSFRQELEYLKNNCKQIESSFTWDTNSTDGAANIDSSSNTSITGSKNLVVNYLDAKNRPCEISSIEQSNAAQEVSDYMEQQDKNPTFSGLDSGVKYLVVSDITSSPIHNGVESLLDGKNNTTELQNGWGEENVGVSAISTTEMMFSEVVDLQRDEPYSPSIGDHFLNLFNASQSTKREREELDNLVENNQNSPLKSASVEEQVQDCLVNETETLCKSIEKSNVFISGRGKKRRRLFDQSVKGFGLYNRRILRSTKCRGGVLVRRSKRLISKVQNEVSNASTCFCGQQISTFDISKGKQESDFLTELARHQKLWDPL